MHFLFSYQFYRPLVTADSWRPFLTVLLLLVFAPQEAQATSSPRPPEVLNTATITVPAGSEIGKYSQLAGRLSALSRGDASANPPAVRLSTAAQALRVALQFASAIHGTVHLTSGTPSMEPIIRGRVYVVTRRQRYDEIREQQLLVYFGRPDPSRSDRQSMLHRAVLRDDGGWIMSGDNNRYSESWDRVTPETYVGTVEAIFEFTQS